jgi:hypothetical protein
MTKPVDSKIQGSFQNPIKINSFEELLKTEDSNWLNINNRIEFKVESENDFAIPGSPNLFVLTYSQTNDNDMVVNIADKRFYNKEKSLFLEGLFPYKGEWFICGNPEYNTIINELNKHK